jgi:glycosyltransferase involved in cell wall biosynthesis
MFIGIEATRANKPQKTGVEWYAWHVIQELKRQTLHDGNAWVLYSNELLSGGLESLPENWYEIRTPWPLKYGWTQVRLSFELYRRPPEVLWMPASTLPRYMPARTVVTCHDIGYHRFPELYKPQQVLIHERATKEIAKSAARIITISEFSARELSEAYGIDRSKIHVTPLGVDHALYRPIEDQTLIQERLERHGISQPFFLYVGRLETKKNILMLIRAFTEFKIRRGAEDRTQLVLAGMPGFGYRDIKQAILDSNVKSDILELGYVPEAELPYLMNAAHALVHPSLYEGFGLTPIQAMACGCPVISSNAASLTEVVGEAGVFFSPHEMEELIHTLQTFSSDPVQRDLLRARGIARAQTYTWSRTASETIPILTQW